MSTSSAIELRLPPHRAGAALPARNPTRRESWYHPRASEGPLSDAAPIPSQQARDVVGGHPSRFQRFRARLADPRFSLLLVYVAVPVVASVHKWLTGPQRGYNNFLIFRRSFLSLWRGEDLYALHPDAHFDLFKYSPTFAFAMGPFALMPAWLGLILWNVINTACLGYALTRVVPAARRPFVHAFIFFELLTTTQNAQSNALMAGLTILALIWLEEGRTGRAALAVAISGLIKVYGFGAAGLFLFFPRRVRAFALLAAFSVALSLLPLLVTRPDQLLGQYRSWGQLLGGDHAASIGISVMGILRSWFAISPDKMLVALVGGVLQGLAFLRFSRWGDKAWRQAVLASLMVFLVIFNHKAESATFIIAVAGVCIWYTAEPRGALDRVLMALAFVLTVLSPTDLFPASLRRTLVVPYALKALPCVLIWVRMQWELHGLGRGEARVPLAPAGSA